MQTHKYPLQAIIQDNDVFDLRGIIARTYDVDLKAACYLLRNNNGFLEYMTATLLGSSVVLA